MKCPNCGEELTEGALYCKHCGEDIHIVPDFEPELESNLEETLHGIREDLEDIEERETQRKQGKHAGGKEEDGREQGPKKGRLLWKVLAVLGVLGAVAAAGLGISGYLYYSEEYQIRQAVRYTENGLYDRAAGYYNRALELDGGNIELRFALAEVYLLKNNKVEYEYLLRGIANDKSATDEQLERAYGKLIAIYRARGDYQTINDLLLAREDENLLSAYQSYLARMPEFSISAGNYTGIQPLKLTSFGSGRIYYTLDGSEPDENSEPYITPILLEDGYYCVKAVFINENGVASDVATGEYYIENDEIPAPVLSVEGGEYHSPVNIEVLEIDLTDIYYTTDGSDPTYLSTRYTEPIPVPLGDSVYKFARVADGVAGDIAEVAFHFEMDSDYTPGQAEADIRQYYLDTGRIRDEAGHFDDSDDVYQFAFQYVTNVNEISDYYVIAVLYQSADGSLTRTGTDYAVDAYTGERFRLEKDYLGRYKLTQPTE
ncbi:MAG: chitobiase/beta-hexosaminidase C-terminal domain-containing protein [bacterium]|nr:chitobiase/beta-hexosaminidase C-terminal domain-containing protein [bacterium]